MKKYMSFEAEKLKNIPKIVFLISFLSQLLFLYFFVIVGRFEDGSSADNILKNLIGVGGLATTLSFSVLSIYGAIVINNFIVNYYIGNHRIHLYTYPYGRKVIFLSKIGIFIKKFVFYQFLGIFLSNLIFLLGEYIVPLANSTENISLVVILFLSCTISGTLLTLTIVIVSAMLGILFATTQATIVSSIVFVVTVGNLVARLFTIESILGLLITVALLIIALFLVSYFGNKIENEEVL